MKYSSIIKDYMTFNRMEQRGLFVLALVFSAILAINLLMPVLIRSKPVDFSVFSREITAFETAIRHADSSEKLEQIKTRKLRFRQTGFTGTDSSIFRKSKPDENLMIELNKADTFDLQRLRGIGPGFAYRIVKYRDRLGGFVSKMQVLEVFGMDSLRFSGISDHLCVDRSLVRPIDLNNVTFKELLSHPYFPFEITKAIMLYRKEHKLIRDPDEIRSVEGIDEVLFRKIRPYVFVK